MKISIIACSFSLGLLSNSVFARPIECTRTPHSNTYDKALNDRVEEMTLKWLGTFGSDCGKQIDFEAIFSMPLAEVGPTQRKCKNAGHNEGIAIVLSSIARQCSREGNQLGAEDGKAFAKEYCGIAAFRKEGDFQIGFEESCKEVFVRYANWRCPVKKHSDPNFYEVVDNKCSLK